MNSDLPLLEAGWKLATSVLDGVAVDFDAAELNQGALSQILVGDVETVRVAPDVYRHTFTPALSDEQRAALNSRGRWVTGAAARRALRRRMTRRAWRPMLRFLRRCSRAGERVTVEL